MEGVEPTILNASTRRSEEAQMRYVVAALVILPLAALVWASVTRRVRLQSCCSPADPAKDLRMRAAFEDDAG